MKDEEFELNEEELRIQDVLRVRHVVPDEIRIRPKDLPDVLDAYVALMEKRIRSTKHDMAAFNSAKQLKSFLAFIHKQIQAASDGLT